jgi:hypothetical protein
MALLFEVDKSALLDELVGLHKMLGVLMIAMIPCTGRAELTVGALPASSDAQRGGETVQKTRDETGGSFVRGPSTTPAGPLAAWFERQVGNGEPRLFRMPLVLKQGSVGFSLRGARIGAAADAIEVYVNDAALGIGLADRSARHCKGRQTCAFWVEAYWRGKQEGNFRVDVMRVLSPIESDVVASANYVEVEAKAGRTIPPPAAWEHGFPIPAGARRNDSLGGATSVAPGKNYTLSVYDIDSGIDAMTAFYEYHLLEAKRASEGQEVRFSTPRGYVRLARFNKGTRITLVVGPR